jgi:hypothetical protein
MPPTRPPPLYQASKFKTQFLHKKDKKSHAKERDTRVDTKTKEEEKK